MSLGRRYDEKLRRSFGYGAVFPPGDSVSLGDFMLKEDGVFRQGGSLSEYGVTFEKREHVGRSLDLAAQGTRQIVLQGNAEIKPNEAINLEASAEVKYEFTREYSYVLKTPQLTGAHISNLVAVGRLIRDVDDWDYDKYFLVERLYTATEFSFIGSEDKTSNFSLAGKGSAIVSFLTAGLAIGLTSKGSASVKMLGASGPVAMGLARVRANGSIDYYK